MPSNVNDPVASLVHEKVLAVSNLVALDILPLILPFFIVTPLIDIVPEADSIIRDV